MIINMKGPVLATIVGFGLIIAIIGGLMIGWKWVAPATEEAAPVVVVKEMTTDAVVVSSDLIEIIESIPNIEDWRIQWDSFSFSDESHYSLYIDIGDEEFSFKERTNLIDFYEDINNLTEGFLD